MGRSRKSRRVSSKRKRKAVRAPQYTAPAYRALCGQLAAYLRAGRAARGWTQEQAAERCELSPTVYRYLESGRHNATLVTLARIALGFGVTVAELLTLPSADGMGVAPRPETGEHKP